MGRESDCTSPIAPAYADAFGNPTTTLVSNTRIPIFAFGLKTIAQALSSTVSGLVPQSNAKPEQASSDEARHTYACFICDKVYEEPHGFLWHIQTCKGKK